MADNIRKINADKTATYGKIYYDLNGQSYIGLANGRLRLESTGNGSELIDNTQDSDLGNYNKQLFYSTTGDITMIAYYTGGKYSHSAYFKYDANSNISEIDYKGKITYKKTFQYNSSGDLIKINILK